MYKVYEIVIVVKVGLILKEGCINGKGNRS